jgi:hypothetical protein
MSFWSGGTTLLTPRRDTKARSDELVVSRIASIPRLAWLCSGLVVLSLFWSDWIEGLAGYAPDQHDGTVEWLIVVALLATAPYWRSPGTRNRAPRSRSSSLD